MGNIPYACMYRSYLEELTPFTDEEVGRLVRGLLQYLNTGVVPELPGREALFWYRFRTQHDRDAEHYEEICESRRNNGKKGGRPPLKPIGFESTFIKPTGLKSALIKPTGFESALLKPKKAKEPIEREKENEKENEKEKEKESEREYIYRDHTLSVSYPSLEEVISFAREEGLTAMDPGRFYDFNASVGWTIKGVPIRDWKAAARLWNSKDAARLPDTQQEVIYGESI